MEGNNGIHLNRAIFHTEDYCRVYPIDKNVSRNETNDKK